MIPIDQTVFGVPGGNCWAACIGSILERSLDDLAGLVAAHQRAAIEWVKGGSFAWGPLLEELHKFDVTLGWIDMNNPELPRRPPAEWSIANGPGPREMPHSCVAYRGHVVHDPHPSREGLLGISSYDILIPVIRAPGELRLSPFLERKLH